MAFLDNFFNSSEEQDMSVITVDEILKEYIGYVDGNISLKETLKFNKRCPIEGTWLYLVQLNKLIEDKGIPSAYHLMMKGINFYLVKISDDKTFKIPRDFGFTEEYVKLKKFSKYVVETTFAEYKGIFL